MIAVLLALAAAAAQPIEGRWLTAQDKAIVELSRCGEELCGRIVSVKRDEAGGGPVKDARNPDPALRDRRVAGLQILTGLKPKGDGWRDGQIYVPDTGKTYSAKLEPGSNGTLTVKGCVGPICQAQVWRRAP